MTTKQNKIRTVFLASLAIVSGFVCARAANITWNTGSGDWDTTSENWRDDSTLAATTYVEGDNVNIRRHIPAGTHTITIQPGGVGPSGLTTHKGSGNTFDINFEGGDITGGVVIVHNLIVTTLTFRRAGSYSFSGGVTQNAPLTFAPQIVSPGAYVNFGTGLITLGDIGRTFTFAPSQAATLTNDFVTAGGKLQGNANARFDSTVTLNGDLVLDSLIDYDGLHLVLTGDRVLKLYAQLSPPGTIFSGQVSGSNHVLTATQSSGADQARYIFDGPGGWDIGGLRKIGVANLLLYADGATFFSGIAANGGTVSIEEGRLGCNTSYDGTFNVGFPLVLKSPGIIQAATVHVMGGGSISGDSTVTGAVTAGTDGTPGTLAPGLDGSGTLNISSHLTLGANARLLFEIDTPGVAGNGVNDLLVVTGNLTLDGTLDVAALAGFSVGTYPLITYTGTFSDNGLEMGTVPLPHKYAYAVTHDALAKTVALKVTRRPPSGTLIQIR